MKHSRTLPLLALAVLAGCGGHGGSSGAARTGRFAFAVAWPARGRYVPTAANFIRITIHRTGETDRKLDFSRSDVDASGGTDEKVLAETLADGAKYTLTANAYATIPASANATITEKPLATSPSTDLTVVAGETTTTTLTMASNLTAFKVALANLVTGTGLSGSPFTLTSSTAANGPTLTPSALLKATITPQNAGTNTLILYPAGSNPTTTLTASGALEVVGTPTVSGNDLIATVVPTGIAADPNAAITVNFADTGTPSLTLPLKTPLSALALNVSATVRGPFVDLSGLGASPTIPYAAIKTGANYTLENLATGGTSGNLGASAVVVSSANDVVAYGVVGGSQVTRFTGSTKNNAVAPGLKFLTQYESANYAVSVAGSTLTVSKLDFTHSAATVVATFDATAANVYAFAMGRDLATGGAAFYTIEGATLPLATVQRYVATSGDYNVDPGFSTIGFAPALPQSIAADGNLVWVLGGANTVSYLTLNGKKPGSLNLGLPVGAVATGISVNGGIGGVSYVEGGQVKARSFTY